MACSAASERMGSEGSWLCEAECRTCTPIQIQITVRGAGFSQEQRSSRCVLAPRH